MSIPNHLAVVQVVNSQFPHLLQQNTVATNGEFTERVVNELAARFPGERWGHVGKNPGQTQCPCSANDAALPDDKKRAHAADAVMSELTPATAIDIIGGAHNPPHAGSPAWQEVTSGGQPWKPPMPVHVGPPVTPPVDPPPVTPNFEARIKALEDKVLVLQNKVTALESHAANSVQYGQKVALRCLGGTVFAVVPDGGPAETDQPITLESRTGIGPWESLTIERGQG